MNDDTLNAFQDELEKIAINWSGMGRVFGGAARRVAVPAAKQVNRAGKPLKKKFWKEVGQNVKNTAKGFKNPIKSVKRGWNSDGGWTGKGKVTGKLPIGGKSLTVAGGLMSAPEAFSKEDPTGQGRSRAHRITKWVGNQTGGLIGAPYGLSGSLVGSIAGELGGHAVGKSLDTLRGYKPKRQAVPEQYIADRIREG